MVIAIKKRCWHRNKNARTYAPRGVSGSPNANPGCGASRIDWSSLTVRPRQRTNGTNTKMTRLRGRCPKSRRLNGKAPFGHWKIQTFIAGLRRHGLTAPFVVDQPMNRRIFNVWVEAQLAPTLSKGDIVILDNLPAHKSQIAEDAIKARGAWLLYLPAYSPDLNPIEMAFSKLKAHLRARNARTIDEL
jgi:transposase